MLVISVIGACVALLLVMAILWSLNEAPAPISSALDHVSEKVGLRDPDKLGWMDDQPYTEADRQRVAQITGVSYPEGTMGQEGSDGHLRVIREIQAGVQSDLTRRDFELLRQDRRRAMAAYPDVSTDDLVIGRWFQVDPSARIPMSWGGPNADGTKIGEEWYLDGGTYLSVVAPQYPNRASAEETKAFFADLKSKRLRERLARTSVSWARGGSGGQLSVDCKDGQCVVIQADEWSRTGHKYTFPFVAAEWSADPGTMEDIKALPSFAQATVEEIDVRPSGVSLVFPSDPNPNFVPYSPGMTLGPGQSTSIGVGVAIPPSEQ
ncbi:MAG: hypothetical protein JO267_14325 [Alphaproteobacteria bacterium]|nr:hypothetical protein [Alphaproteobacteria bacterium]